MREKEKMAGEEEKKRGKIERGEGYGQERKGREGRGGKVGEGQGRK